MNATTARRNARAIEASASELKDLILEMTNANSVRSDRYRSARAKAITTASMLAYACGYAERTGMSAATAGRNAVNRLWTMVQTDRHYMDGDPYSCIHFSFRGMTAFEHALREAYEKDINRREDQKLVLDSIRDMLSYLDGAEDAAERSRICSTVENAIRHYYGSFLKKVMKVLVPGATEEDYRRTARVTYLRIMGDRRREGFLQSLTPAQMLSYLREDACTGRRIHATTRGMAHAGHLSSRDLTARVCQMAVESAAVRRTGR